MLSSLDLLGDQTLHLFLLSSKNGRSKGYLTLNTVESPDWTQRLDIALSVGVSGDRFLLVAPALDGPRAAALEQVLRAHGVRAALDPEAERHLSLWWKVGAIGNDEWVAADLQETVTLRL